MNLAKHKFREFSTDELMNLLKKVEHKDRRNPKEIEIVVSESTRELYIDAIAVRMGSMGTDAFKKELRDSPTLSYCGINVVAEDKVGDSYLQLRKVSNEQN